MKSWTLIASILIAVILFSNVGNVHNKLFAKQNYGILEHPTAQQNDNTCQAYFGQAYNIAQAVVLGDSILNFSPMEDELLDKLTSIGVSISSSGFAYTISGWGIENAVATLNSGALDADIASSDAIILNLGVNNWNEAQNDLAQVQNWIDQFITTAKETNPDIIIFWIEPHAVDALAPNTSVAPNALLIAEYLNTKDRAGEICLVDWSTYADNNPQIYTTLTSSQEQPLPADGIHIYGHNEEYVGLLISVMQTVMNANPPAPHTMLGDVNCDLNINLIDSLFIMQHDIQMRADFPSCPLGDIAAHLYSDMGDVSADGLINSVDALLILQCDVGIANSFCP